MTIEDNTLARLATGRDGSAFLAPHHMLAAARLEHLIARSRVVARVTMSYDPTRVGRSAAGNGAAEVSDSAADARQKLNRLAGTIPADCWGVVFDVCGLGKGLQEIETERRWPRRSAKLVLRIGLDQLAQQFGLQPVGQGADHAKAQSWLDERLPIIARNYP